MLKGNKIHVKISCCQQTALTCLMVHRQSRGRCRGPSWTHLKGPRPQHEVLCKAALLLFPGLWVHPSAEPMRAHKHNHTHPQQTCSRTHAGCTEQSKQTVSERGSTEKSIRLVSSGVDKLHKTQKEEEENRKMDIFTQQTMLLLNESLTGMWHKQILNATKTLQMQSNLPSGQRKLQQKQTTY